MLLLLLVRRVTIAVATTILLSLLYVLLVLVLLVSYVVDSFVVVSYCIVDGVKCLLIRDDYSIQVYHGIW